MTTEKKPQNPTRRGLLIGIDSYPNIPGANLEGCVQDAVNLAKLLRERFQFAQENLALLLNEQASRARILAALDDLAQRTEADDVVVVHYSGHGSQVVDLAGNEGDGLNETLVAADSGRGQLPNRDVIDDELAPLFKRISAKTRYLTVIFDCCHSGTGTRDVFGAKSRGLPPDLRDASATAVPQQRSIERPSSNRLGYAFIGGCRDDEKAFEYQARLSEGVLHQGALSYFLHRELATVSGPVSLRMLFERVARHVSESYPSQHPQAEGDLDRAVFGTEDLPAIEASEIGSRTGNSVVLHAGVVHGATVGSTYTVFPSREQLAPAYALGTVEIQSVSATTSSARILEERQPGAITASACARELRHALGEPGLTIEVMPCAGELASARVDLLAALSRCTNLRVTSDGSAMVRIYGLGARVQCAAKDPVPQLGALTEPVWAAVERDGELMLPALSLGNPSSATALASALGQLARKRALLLLENTSATASLRGAVTCELLTQRDGKWNPVSPNATGQIPLVEKTRVAVRITNRSTQPIYPFLFYVGIEGSIDLLFPSEVRWEQWLPGRSFIFGGTDDTKLEVELPEGFPWHGAARPHGLDGGTGYLKLVATVRPVDLGAALSQGSAVHELRAAGVLASHRDLEGAAIDELLSGMLSGTRNIRISRSGLAESFETVTLPLFMYRKAESEPVSTQGKSDPIGSTPQQQTTNEDHFEVTRDMLRDEDVASRDITISSDRPEYPGASFFAPAASSNFRRWTSSSPRSVSTIVIHITDGREKITGPIGHFQKPGLQASAHYIVGRDGQVVQMVRHRDIAWHATTANSTSIGIEHCARSPKELGRDDPGLPVTQAQYQASAKLVRFLCQQLGVPIDRVHIKGHCEAAKTTHEDCPNRIWDWGFYMGLLTSATPNG